MGQPASQELGHRGILDLIRDDTILAATITSMPQELLLMTENELKRTVKPTSTDYSLRVSFWREYEKFMAKGGVGKMSLSPIYMGICSEEYFLRKFCKRHDKVAWLIRPIQTYEKEMEAILARGTERLWELMKIPIYKRDKNGKKVFDAAAAGIVLDVVKAVENRVKGMAVQRMVSQTKNLNVNVETAAISAKTEDMTEIDARIRELEAAVKPSLPPRGEVLTVEVTDCQQMQEQSSNTSES